MPKYTPILIGSIKGGEVAIFKLINYSPLEYHIPNDQLSESVVRTSDFEDISHCLTSVLKSFQNTDKFPQHICLAIASPVRDNVFKITNSNWPVFFIDTLIKSTGVKSIRIINDFEAIGYGVLSLTENSLIKINNNPVLAQCPKIVIGPEVGLGECYLTPNSTGKYTVNPCEGSHADFAANNFFEYGYMEFIKNELEIDHVSVERCVSGQSIPLLYQYIKNTFNDTRSIIKKGSWVDMSIEILEKATTDHDFVCERVVDTFLYLLGCEVRRLALKFLPYGGIYLASPIVEKLKEKILSEKSFNFGFLSNELMRDKLIKMPIFIVNSSVELKGVEEAAYNLIQ